MDKKIENKTFTAPIEVKAEADGAMRIRAYCCAFNNIDCYGDIIEDGACDAFLASDDAPRMKFCNQHDMRQVLGPIVDKGVNSYGMWIEADILDTSIGKDVQKLIKAGALDEMSIGYYADDYRFERRDGYDYQLRILSAITIVEASIVTRAANPKAVILDAKSDGFNDALQGLPAADFDLLYKKVNKEYARRVLANL